MPLAPGAAIGPYVVLSPLGSVGMGKHVLFPALRMSSSIWMIENFAAPTWTERLRVMF